jgi:hypothetical protein
MSAIAIDLTKTGATQADSRATQADSRATQADSRATQADVVVPGWCREAAGPR